VAGFDRADGGASLLLGSALYPQVLIAADFASPTALAPKRLTLVNLNNGGNGQ
jgi:hypothetical protein